MSTFEQRIAALCVLLVAGVIFLGIFLVDQDSRRADDRAKQLQEQCIARGGSWDYGCEMKK